MQVEKKIPARHTKESFDDVQTIGFLSTLLAKSNRFMPDLKANNKRPNIDE